MFDTIFGEFPIRYYTYKDYDKAINEVIKDTLSFTGESNKRRLTSYTLKEIDGNIVFKCLAPSITKDKIEMSIKDKILKVKSLKADTEMDFFTPIDITLKLQKDIDSQNSFADLVNGVLIITMPIIESAKENLISFK